MTGYEFGDLVPVSFPFSDQSTTKRRPAVVVSSDAYHRERPEPAFGDAAVAKWKEAGLLRPSVLKPVVATIERGLVLRKLGRLEDEDRAALRKVLAEILSA
jgi:mRNA interferase MazF